MQLLLPRRFVLLSSVVFPAIIAGGLSYVYLPRARIEIIPKTSTRTVSQDILLSASAEEPDYARYILPAKVLKEEVEIKETFHRKSQEEFDGLAHGEVTFHNHQAEEQKLLPKTHLKHEASGAVFLTDEAVAIPPRGATRVTVTAEKKGPSGNVAAGRLVVEKLPASLQKIVYAESDHQFSGGVAVKTPLSETELAQAKQAAAERARQRLRGQLTAAAGGAAIRPDLIAYEEDTLKASVQPGSQDKTYAVTARISAQALVVDENDLLSLTLLSLRQSSEVQEEFEKYDSQSFAVSIKRGDFKRGEAVVVGRLTGTFAMKVSPTAFSGSNLAGLSKNEVRERLRGLSGVGDVTVSFSPFWVNAIPAREEAVEITVVGHAADSELARDSSGNIN